NALCLGRTPVTARLMVAGEYLIRLKGEGAGSLEMLARVEPDKSLQLERALLPLGKDWDGLVRVEGTDTIPAFLIDRYEVTNAQFARFVASGGHRHASLWGRQFVDRTGTPGPRGWSRGSYPEGRENHPVTGVSWNEAKAYARWAGRELPTLIQWRRAALGDSDFAFPWGD